MSKRLFRSRKNKYLAGVCGGIAEYFNIDPTIVRIIIAVFAFPQFWMVMIAYVIATIIIPERPIDYAGDDYDENEATQKGLSFGDKNSRQVLGMILIGVGGLILFSRMVSWFDSSMIMAVGIVAIGIYIVFKKKDD